MSYRILFGFERPKFLLDVVPIAPKLVNGLIGQKQLGCPGETNVEAVGALILTKQNGVLWHTCNGRRVYHLHQFVLLLDEAQLFETAKLFEVLQQ